MAKYLSILVNGGKQVKPTIVKTVLNSDGTEIDKTETNNKAIQKLGYEAEKQENVEIAPENLKAIMEGMKGVTSERGGTAYSVFKNFNIEVGGKTGSAQKGDATNALFAGFAPYDNPEIAIICIIENGGSGAIACYPARDVIAQYFGMNASEIDEDTTATSYIMNEQ